jgi:hypothetical protein
MERKPLRVIPGRRESAEPGIQGNTRGAALDSGFAPFGAPRNDGLSLI